MLLGTSLTIALGAALLGSAHSHEGAAPPVSHEAPSAAQPADALATQPSDLIGTWDVSLFFSPTQPPSSTVMEITEVNRDGTIKGTFYGTEFEKARFSQRNGVIAFAMITRDGSGLYATSGRLTSDGGVEGQTFATGRDFVMIWSAKRR